MLKQYSSFLIQNNLNMESKMCDVDKLTSKLLELSKQLATSSKSFIVTLRTKDINFLTLPRMKFILEPQQLQIT